MIDLSKIEISEVKPMSPEEELKEAEAWGYDSVECFIADMDKAIQECEEMNHNMRVYGTIDKPKESDHEQL